jgi:hypothetical protein
MAWSDTTVPPNSKCMLQNLNLSGILKLWANCKSHVVAVELAIYYPGLLGWLITPKILATST